MIEGSTWNIAVMKTKIPIETKDYFLTQESFSLIKTKGLDVYKTTPRIKKEAIG